MCGCVGFFSDELSINDAKGLLSDFINDIGMLSAHHNIAPSQPLPALCSNHRFIETTFGLIPYWTKD